MDIKINNKFQDSTIKICPLTSVIITDPVMTIVGSIYQRSAIRYWLKLHDIDPLTKLPLISKVLLEFNHKIDNWVECSHNQFIFATTCLLPYRISMTQLSFYDEAIKIKKEIDIIDHNVKSKNLKNEILKLEIEKSNNYKYVSKKNLNFLEFESKVFDCYYFKNINFSGCDLHNAYFIDCVFDNTIFCISNLECCIFERCIFKGEDTCFNEAITDEYTDFIDCEVENIYNTNRDLKKKLIKQNLNKRGLKGSFLITKNFSY